MKCRCCLVPLLVSLALCAYAAPRHRRLSGVKMIVNKIYAAARKESIDTFLPLCDRFVQLQEFQVLHHMKDEIGPHIFFGSISDSSRYLADITSCDSRRPSADDRKMISTFLRWVHHTISEPGVPAWITSTAKDPWDDADKRDAAHPVWFALEDLPLTYAPRLDGRLTDKSQWSIGFVNRSGKWKIGYLTLVHE